MFGDRLSVSVPLRLMSDLHIGGAEDGMDLPNDHGQNERTYSAAPFLRDISGPVIPASTLKGVVRSAAEQFYGLDLDDQTFGKITNHDEDLGVIAKLWFDHAALTSRPQVDAGVSKEKAADGLFLQRHVGLDPKTGAAQRHKFFLREMVAKGAEFKIKFDWFGLETDADLITLLAILANGVQLGKGTSKGAGQAKIMCDQLQVTEFKINTAAILVERSWTNQEITNLVRRVNETQSGLVAPSGAEITLKFIGDGPFISVRKVKKDGEQDGSDDRPGVLPLMRGGKPLLWPESLVGALRARAHWLWEVARVKNSDQDQDLARGRDRDVPIDDMDLAHLFGARRHVETRSDVKKLSAVEQLFGVSGYRGRLEVKDLRCTNAGSQHALTSVSLDRITGAGRDGFLFTERPYWDVTFEATLIVRPQADKDDQAKVDQLVDCLISDLTANGIELGHGSSKGFGWFDVEATKRAGR